MQESLEPLPLSPSLSFLSMTGQMSTRYKSCTTDNALFLDLGYTAVSFIITHNYKLYNSCKLVLFLHVLQYNIKIVCLKFINGNYFYIRFLFKDLAYYNMNYVVKLLTYE